RPVRACPPTRCRTGKRRRPAPQPAQTENQANQRGGRCRRQHSPRCLRRSRPRSAYTRPASAPARWRPAAPLQRPATRGHGASQRLRVWEPSLRLPQRCRQGHHRLSLQRLFILPSHQNGESLVNTQAHLPPPINGQPPLPKTVRCAVYTRKSNEEGLQQEFNSLDAQREAAQAYIASQQHEGWTCLAQRYDDGGFSGGNMDRPALQRLLADLAAGHIDCVIVYKVDRLSRSLLDFAKMMATFDRHRIAFVSVTQQFNTASSMGRLILNVLLSFAQFEREIISE